MAKPLCIAFLLSTIFGCTPIVDDFTQVPGDAPSTEQAVATDSSVDAGTGADTDVDASVPKE